MNADFQSPKRKRKVPSTTRKRYSALSRKISESPYKLFEPKPEFVSGPNCYQHGSDGEEADVSNLYCSAMESPDRSTVPRKYKAATHSDGDSTKAVHSPPTNGFTPNHLATAFPQDAPDTPIQYENLGPRNICMETCNDSSLSTISHNNSAILNSPPRYLFDSNGTDEGLDVYSDHFVFDNYNSTTVHATSNVASLLVDMNVQPFDDVQFPEVGSISMCTSPQHDRRDQDVHLSSPTRCAIVLSPTILRNSPSPRVHQFSCVRQMSFGEEGFNPRGCASSPLHFNCNVVPQVHSPAIPRRTSETSMKRTVVKNPDPTASTEVDSWHSDSSGVAKGMSTLNVNKHSYEHDDSQSEEAKGKHKFRRGLAGGAINSGECDQDTLSCTMRSDMVERNGPSPIMSNHTSFMELLDAASESPMRKPPQVTRPGRHGEVVDLDSRGSSSSSLPQPIFSLGSHTLEGSPFKHRGSTSTPYRMGHSNKDNGANNSYTVTHQKKGFTEFDSPSSIKNNSPGTLLAVEPPASSGAKSNYSSPSTSRIGKRLDLSPPGSFTSVASEGTSCTEDDEIHSPPRKFGASRSIASEFANRYGLDVELQRCNSSNSVTSNHSNGSSLPLPDQSAFDHSVVKPRKSTGSRGVHSPVCPPTPDRSNVHWGSSYGNNSVGSIDMVNENDTSALGEEEDDDFISGGWHNSLAQAYPLLRQNSLDVNKILVEGEVFRDPSDTSDIIFDRDFYNLGVLGAGSFAVVYFAQRKKKEGSSIDDSERKYFAVKKNKKKFRGHGDRECLLNEVRMMKLAGTTTCPHIVHLIRAWQEDGFFYVQMDIAEKGSLRDLVVNMYDNDVAFPDSTIWRLIRDTLLGLRHIHSYNVVHLDIKPANLLISRSGRVMIGDFGLAAQAHDDKDANEGDARYMAPEMLNSSDRGPAVDMFSFGLTFYELCLVPTDRANLPVQGELWTQLREGKIPPVETEYESRTQAMSELLLACLTPLPEQRATADQLLRLPEILNVANTCRAENEESLDPILSALPVAVTVPVKMAKTTVSSMPGPPSMTRPDSFRLAFDSSNIPPIDTGLCNQASRQRMVSPNYSEMTPTHADENIVYSAAMFKFIAGLKSQK